MSVLSPPPPLRLLLHPSTGITSHNALLFLRPTLSTPTLCRPFSSYSRTSDSVAHRCLAAARGPPPPNEGNRRPERIPIPVSQIRDSVQIFLAVLFWMSLFFWSSAWDGRDRPNKGPRWRR